MEPENYNNDTIKYEIYPAILNFLAKGINFNYDVTDIIWSLKDPVNDPSIIIPGLRPQICEEILYYLLEIQNYVNNKPSIYNKIFENPREIKTGLEDIDTYFNRRIMLTKFKEWKINGPIPDNEIFSIVYNVIEILINSFLGKKIINPNISLLESTPNYPPYWEYFAGTKRKII